MPVVPNLKRAFRLLAPVAATCFVAVAATAHEDDPKILDFHGPIAGQGFRPAAFTSGGSLAPMPGLSGSQIGSQALITELSDGHVTFPSSGVQLLSWLPLKDLEATAVSGNDCWGYVSPSGREYAIMGLSNGTTFVEITDPSDPVVIYFQPGETSLWRDVKTYLSYAYIVSEGGGGIQIVDMSQIDNGVVTLANTYTGGGQTSHNVAIDTVSGFLYRCGGGSGQGIRAYSLANPASPSYQGAWNSRYVHDLQVVTYESGPYAGKQIAFACSGFGNGGTSTGLTVLDVTNKSNMITRDQFYYGNAAYSHQAWLSADRTKLFLNDELDEDGILPTTTHVMDVSNLDNVQHLGTFTNGNRAIGHNLYTHEGNVFEANYRSGLRIFDGTSGASATETAYFDTWPGDDNASFNGLWSVYPFFPSGVVIGSDLERGLFVWWIGDPELEFQPTAAVPTLMSPNGGEFSIQITETSAGLLQTGTEKLYYDAGNGLVESAMLPQGAGVYKAQIPAIQCDSTVHWFVGARSTTGIFWTYPSEAPYSSFDISIAESELVAFEDDFEADLGWTVGGPDDTAVAGIWDRVVPVGSAVSPSGDHSPTGTLAYSTTLGGDVDGGFTTLTSPTLNLDGLGNAVVSFWLFFGRNGLAQATDQIRIEISNDNGSNWVLMDRIKSLPLQFQGSWMHLSYRVSDWVAPNSTTRVRFQAQDENLDTMVKATVDDFRITSAECGCQASNYCVAGVNSNGTAAAISQSGTASISANNFTLDVTGALPGALGLFFYGSGQAQIPLAEGTLCVVGGASGIHRLQPPLSIDGAGNGSRYLDFTQAPANAGPGAISAGSTFNFQFWYRDPTGGPGGSNLSDGLEVIFCQ